MTLATGSLRACFAALFLVLLANCGGGTQATALPAAVPAMGRPGQRVVLRGGPFAAARAVLFQGVAADFTILGEAELQATVPAGALTGPIEVDTGAQVLTTPLFRVLRDRGPAPVVELAEPLSGPPGAEVRMAGAGFTGVTAVAFAGTAAEFQVRDDTELRAVVPVGAAAGAITVTGPGGQALTEPFTPAAGPRPGPEVTTVLPSRGVAGAPMTLLGTGFTGATAVRFGGVEAAFKVISYWRLEAHVPPGAVTGRLTVATAAGDAQPAGLFEVDGAPPPAHAAPVLLSMEPASGPVGTRIVLAGTGLAQVDTVRLGLAPAPFEPTAEAQLTVAVPPGAVSGPVTVYSPGGGEAVSPPFVVTAPEASGPQVDAVFPTRPHGPAPPPALVAADTVLAPIPGQTPLTLMGKSFTGTVQVAFNGVPAPFMVLSDTRIDTWVPPGASGPIAVTSVTGQTSLIAIVLSAGPPAAPTLTGIQPPAGPPGALVILAGSDLQGATAVTFGGVAAAFKVISPLRVDAIVPAGAVTGALAVTTPDGAVTAAFTVQPPPPPVPAVLAMQPAQGVEGAQVLLTGTRLEAVTGVFFGALPAAFNYTAAGLSAVVPRGAPTGPLTLAYPGGALTTGIFTVTFAAPALTALAPASGPVGCPVDVTGEHFENVLQVLFGDVAVPLVTVLAPTRLKVQVPAGARTGAVTLVTRGGKATSAAPFQVTAGRPSNLAISVASLTFNQAVQLPDGAIPLVKDRPALLRVQLQANEANTAKPVVRIRFWDAAGTEQPSKDLPARLDAVPTAPSELGTNFTLLLPGQLLQPGLGVQAEVDPDHLIPDLDRSRAVYPGPGEILLPVVQEVPPIRVTVIPVVSGGLTGNANLNGRQDADWVSLFTRMFPTSVLDVSIGAPWSTDLDLTTAKPDPWTRALAALKLKRLADPKTVGTYLVGAVNAPVAGGELAGLAYAAPGRATRAGGEVLVLDGSEPDSINDFASICAHELGHALGRAHSPCGDPAGVDPAYRPAGGLTGATGVDLLGAVAKDGKSHYDVMAYCHPRWISAYTYSEVLATLTAPTYLAAPPAGAALLVWGSVRGGHAELQPAFQVTTVPQPPASGPYTLEALDGAGQVLLSVPFALDTTEADAPGDGSFAFSLPAPGALARLRVLREGRVLADATGQAAPLSREPVATAYRPGTAYLGWDTSTHPMVLVQDARTGETLAVGAQGGLELSTDATELDVLLSDGVHTLRRRIPVSR